MKGDDRQPQRRDHYQEVTDRIVAALERGTVPWRRPWDSAVAAPTGPRNAVTGNRYRGINILQLGCHPLAFESGDPRWCSYDQARQKGWQVRKGERGTPVYFFKKVEVDGEPGPDGEVESKVVPVLKSYTVFHASQIDGIPPYQAPTVEEAPWREPQAVRDILDASGVPIRVGGDKAFYSPVTDHIGMPVAQAFSSPDAWAATALHELGHATGHRTRLDRDLSGRFGSKSYAAEELVAELASVFMTGELGLTADVEQHASYLDSWLEVLKSDKRSIFKAASEAGKASDWVLSRHPAYAAAMGEVSDPVGTAMAARGTASGMEVPEHMRRRLEQLPEVIPIVTAPAVADTFVPRM